MIKKIIKTPYTWLMIKEVFTFIVNYGLVIYLAYVLEPKDFGIVTLLNLFTGFFSVIAGFGIGKIVVKDQIKNNIKLSAVLTATLLLSAIIFLFAAIILPIYLWIYFSSIQEYYFLGLLSLLSIFTGVIFSFVISIYIRDKEFIKMSKLLIISYTFSFVVIFIFSLFVKSTVTLLFKQLIIALTPITILLAKSDFKYHFVYSKQINKYFINFSKFITADNIFNYFVRNIDYLILGKFFDKGIVGQYSLAYKILLTPVKMIVKQIDQVSFPSLSKMSTNIKGFKNYYLNNIGIIAQTIFPGVIAIILFSNILVTIFFNEKYDKLPLIISFLSISAIFQGVTALAGNLFIISGNTKQMFKLSIVKFIILFFTLYLAATYKDIYIFTITYSLVYIITNFTLSNYYALKPFNMSIMDIVKKMTIPTVLSVLILGIIFILNYFYKINKYIVIIMIGIALSVIYLLINVKIRNILGLKKDVWYSRYL